MNQDFVLCWLDPSFDHMWNGFWHHRDAVDDGTNGKAQVTA
jgi:hypothetical protein